MTKFFYFLKLIRINNLLLLALTQGLVHFFLFEDNEEYYITPNLAWSRLSDKFNNILDIKTFDHEAIFTNNPMTIHGVYGTKLTSENSTGGPFFSNIIKNYK